MMIKKRKLFWPIIGGLVFLCMFCIGAANILQSIGLLPKTTQTPTIIAMVIEATQPGPTQAPTQTITPSPIPTSSPSISIPVLSQLFACIPQNTERTLAHVKSIVDGDTIDVEIDGELYTIRYIGMDTPESTTKLEFYGPEASEKNAELVADRDVILIKDISETDRYGRLLRYVFVGDTFINYELVHQGFANPATYPPDVACKDLFLQAEQEAKLASAGLWMATESAPVEIIQPSPVAAGNGAPCDCSGPDLDCGDFSSHSAAQACFDSCGGSDKVNIFRLDGSDHDGKVCETLP